MPPERAVSGRRYLVCALAGSFLFSACRASTDDRSSDVADGTAPNETLLLASAKVALPPEGVTPADLPDPESAGADLLATYCTPCHALPSPGSHSPTDWPRVVRRMWLRAEGITPPYDIPLPTSAERVTLVQYLIENALDVSRAALPGGPNRARFATVCSRCHELPDPRQHTPDDWSSVVDRMALRMDQVLGEQLLADDAEAIEAYLRSAAAGR